MGDLDTSLIEQFQLVPAFYNKSSPHFKNKQFIEASWVDISNKLGYEVTMLKDRMYQLRNRYNLEKRKIIAMKDEGIRSAKSSWHLFEKLRFLDNHIRPRKSYKGMMRKEGFLFDTYKDNDQDYVPNGVARKSVHAPRRGRPPLVRKEIKDEKDDNDVSELFQREYETEDDANDTQNGDEYLNPANFLEDTESENNDFQLIDSNVNYTNGISSDEHKPSLTVRSINSLKRSLQDTGDSNFREAKMHKASDKFEAFGNFVTASLQDLPENKSLEIIEKFTNEIVRALIEH